VQTAKNSDPDIALILEIKKGKKEAFAVLIDKYKKPLINLLFRLVHDQTEAEDLAQATFVQVYKSLDKFNFSSRFSTWIFTIARNLALNELRRRSRHPADSMELEVESDEGIIIHQYEDKRSPVPCDHLIKEELFKKVEEALSKLPENQRTAIILFQQEDMSYDEIAEVLGCSVSATKSLIHRARETLKAILKPYLQTGQWEEDKHLKNKKEP
jgi:RNA polymerase sigma-70 factor (ECF subfamily)